MLDRINTLAQLETGDVSEELERMVGYVGKLSEVDTAGVEPMVQPVVSEARLREDVVVNGDEREALMRNAPQVMDEMFRVPRSI
ncbi:MAG: Asp-tRNA(Asn)/Glu-tRNA(Gln) amidotransferase subunit GatC [Eubacterium sp.]|nr:Asp-tRNA(Asn)/Glu-tRNA(Gln) amidotransferase subunit GatC [Eubacterium sp.]